MSTENNKSGFSREIAKFIDHLDSLNQTMPMISLMLQATKFMSEKKAKEYLQENTFTSKDEEGEEQTTINQRAIPKFIELSRDASNSKLAYNLIQRNFIVALISQFDAFIGSLIRKMFLIKPEMISSSEKSLTFSRLSEFDSIENAKEYIIEKEIETVLRDSHSNQFKWLENKLGVPLTKDLKCWQQFIEVTERRNLFVHSDGIVSNQYITVCNKANIILNDDIIVGKKLEVDSDYLKITYRVLYELGVKLSQVMWRKLLPQSLIEADSDLSGIIYRLLRRKKHHIAIQLSDFATDTLKKHGSHESKLIFLVNKAQAYKWNGQVDISQRIMKNLDWSAMSDKFKLSQAVILDDYTSAYKFMNKIGKHDEDVSAESYKEWPLFQKIRKENRFLEIYKSLFDEDYEYMEYDEFDLFKARVEETEESEDIANQHR